MVELNEYMETRNPSAPPNPPGVIPALVEGFNVAASHIGVVLFPVVLDLFLWLGPRLSAANLLKPLFSLFGNDPAVMDELFPIVKPGAILEGMNIFGAISTFPIGISSLLSRGLAPNNPFGVRAEWMLDNWLFAILVVFGLNVVGWVLGSLYYWSVARTALKSEDFPPAWMSVLQGILFSLLGAFIFIVAGIPVVLFSGLMRLISPVLFFSFLFLLQFLLMWVVVPAFFSMHGMFAEKKNVFKSIVSGVYLARYAFPSAGWFILVALVLSQGLNYIWIIPPMDSWFTLFGIFGHAFISTALLAASFIYYQQMNGWIREAHRWLHTQASSSNI